MTTPSGTERFRQSDNSAPPSSYTGCAGLICRPGINHSVELSDSEPIGNPATKLRHDIPPAFVLLSLQDAWRLRKPQYGASDFLVAERCCKEAAAKGLSQ